MYHIIVNPASRSGNGIKTWKIVEPLLLKRGIRYTVFLSKRRGAIARETQRLCSLNQPIKLIILGGDGTINEAIQGITSPERFILGYIPTGSSNDLARSLQLPTDPEKALNLILTATSPKSLDIGELTYHSNDSSIPSLFLGHNPKKRKFADSFGIGFDAAVCASALASPLKDKLNRLGLGKLTYLGIALKQIITAKRVACEIYLDGSDSPITLKRFLFITAMIHPFEGGGFKFCPQADSQDGLLDICVVGDFPKIIIPFVLPTAFWGKHYFVKGISFYRATSIRIKSATPLWVHTDGEVVTKSDHVDIFCKKRIISFIY